MERAWLVAASVLYKNKLLAQKGAAKKLVSIPTLTPRALLTTYIN